MERENNIVNFAGEIVSECELSHEVYGEKFFRVIVRAVRSSGVYDDIPVLVSDHMIDINALIIGSYVDITGKYRSYNQYQEKKNRLLLYIFPETIKFVTKEEKENINTVKIDGYICKTPIYRKTPLGREITDVMVAVNRQYGKSDYLPCITWGRNAHFAANLEVGTRIKVVGRLQSRDYEKKIGEDSYEKKVAYEVSISQISVVDEIEEVGEN